MRLVLIAPFARYPKGTTRGRVLPLARALAAKGHDVTVLIPPYDNPRESGHQYLVGKARVETLDVPADVPEQSLRQAVLQPRLAAALLRRALALNPDVVHIAKPKAVSGLAQTLFWYRRRLSRSGPAVVLDTDDWEGFGGWNEYETYPFLQKLVCDWQERWGLTHADALTVASRTLETQAWSHRVPPGQVSYLPNGLDPDDYAGWREVDPAAARERLGLGGGPVLLLYTRFFEFQPDRIAATLEGIRRQVPDVKLLVVGAGKYGQERRLATAAALSGLSESIVFAGWQAPEALPGLLRATDVALVPSDDTLANRAKCSAKLLELLWLGIPVVADRVGQQAEYVHDGQHGLLSDPAEPQSMAAAAVRLVRDKELAIRLAEAARLRAEDTFNWSRLSSAAEEAYAAALSRGPARA